MINVFAIDDHPIFIEGVENALKKYSNKISFIGSATYYKDALSKLKALDIDIVLQDLLMPVVNGAECCRMIKESFPNIKVVAVTGELNPVLLHEAWRNGIDSIVLKDSGGEELYQALIEVANGRRFFSRGLPDFIFPDKKSTTGVQPNLTPREREVLLQLAQNTNRKQVADKLFLSAGGLKFHITNMTSKFNVHSLSELLAKARELRYIQ